MPSSFEQQIENSLQRLVQWVQQHDYKGYEPADGNSSVLFPLTGGQVLPMRALQQIVLRSPINIRPLIGIAAHESAIGRGYLAWGYLLMLRRAARPELRDEAVKCLDWLIANRAPRQSEFCWADPYEYATRSGRRPYGEPLLIWSSLIGLAFLEAFDVLRDDRYLSVARSVGTWIRALPAEKTSTGDCLSYVAYRQSSIHNSNAMGAAFLARLACLTGDRSHASAAQRAMAYTCMRQRSDGAWFYAEEPKYHWVDNFHTGYVLSALKVYRESTGDSSFDAQKARGLEYFIANFFEYDGRPKYFDTQTDPVDIQCVAQAIETLVGFSGESERCLPLARRVAQWATTNMQAGDGHFYYRDLGWMKVRTPMLHWGQGTMVKALAVLLNRETVQHA